VVQSLKSLPLPDDPALAQWAATLNGAGQWAQLYDASWRLVFVTDDLRSSFGDTGTETQLAIGLQPFSAEGARLFASLNRDPPELRRARFLDTAGYVLATLPGGRDEFRRAAAPEYADLVDEIQPKDVPAAWWSGRESSTFAGVDVTGSSSWFRIDDGRGHLAGFCTIFKPAAGMSQLAAAAFTVDLEHLERMQAVERPDRRPAAILMADLEASSPLARRLSTPAYFALTRRLVRASDQCVVDTGGIVGRHVGDGVVAYFLAETAGSESAAAAACVRAAQRLRGLLDEIGQRSEIPERGLSLRFGLHWGATLYVGRILTAGRSEVTGLGDDANEAARIEACATGGRTLASKPLIERLTRADADALGLDITHMRYTPLAELSTATDKAQRDAPAIPVCDITPAP
jgi:class 3 adenylate cyclase